jgi:hypothetical protein
MTYQFPLTVKYDNNGKPIGLTETNSVSVSSISATTVIVNEAVFDYVSALSSNITADLNDYTFALNIADYSGSPKTPIKVTFSPISPTGIPAIPINPGTILNIAADGSSIEAVPDSFVTYNNLYLHLGSLAGVNGNNIHWHLSTLNSYFVNTSGDTMTGVLNASAISSVDYIDFDTTASPAILEGRIRWNDIAKTLEIGSAGSDLFEVGQELSIRIRNQTGFTLSAGQIVYVSGYSANIPAVALASASSEGTSHKGLGVVKNPIDNNQRGLMIIKGILSGINTSSFTEGQILKLDTTPGKFTSGFTAAPSHNEWIGSVVKSDTNGILLVDVQHGYEVNELHNVSRTNPSATGQILSWNNSTSIYEPKYNYNTLTFTIQDPSSISSVPLFYSKNMNGIEEVHSVIDSASSVSWRFYLTSDASDPESGTLLFSETTTSLTTGDTITGTSLSEGWVVLLINTVDGSVNNLYLTVRTY